MRLEQHVTIAADREQVWKLIADPARYPRLMNDLYLDLARFGTERPH